MGSRYEPGLLLWSIQCNYVLGNDTSVCKAVARNQNHGSNMSMNGRICSAVVCGVLKVEACRLCRSFGGTGAQNEWSVVCWRRASPNRGAQGILKWSEAADSLLVLPA